MHIDRPIKTVLLLIFISLSLIYLSHSGRTDSQGGHHDRKNGTYHFHHGDDFEQYDDKFVAASKSQEKRARREASDKIFWSIAKYVGLGFIILMAFNYLRSDSKKS